MNDCSKYLQIDKYQL